MPSHGSENLRVCHQCKMIGTEIEARAHYVATGHKTDGPDDRRSVRELLLAQSDELRDRVDASRASEDGPTEDEDALLAEAERLEAEANAFL